MISAIGRKPIMAAPIAVPTIACSEIGRVPHPLPPETLKEANGGLEYASGGTDVLSEEDHVRVGLKLVGDGLGDRLAAGELGSHR